MKHIQDPSAPERTVDVYRVGLWDDLHTARGQWLHDTHPGAKRAAVRSVWRSLKRLRRYDTWRARRNYFNGFLAEPVHWPQGLTRCGSGWTRRRALDSLHRLINRAGSPS